VIAKLLGNIEAAPILIIGSGRPINLLTGFDANRNSAFPLSSRPLGLGRNSLSTTSQEELDLRVLKFFKVGEHGKLDFVVESFNLLNHTNVEALNQFFGPESSPIPVFTRLDRTRRAFQGNCSCRLTSSSDEFAINYARDRAITSVMSSCCSLPPLNCWTAPTTA
jgi:hypothetical protein